MHSLYECLAQCTPYFVESGEARLALRSAVGVDKNRYAQAAIHAQQLLWSEEIFAGFPGLMPYILDPNEIK